MNPSHLQRPNATNPYQRLSRVEDRQELLAGDRRGRLLDGSLLGLADELLSAEGLGVRVKTEENGLVAEGVLLLGEWPCKVSSSLRIRLTDSLLATAWPAGRRTDWISSELMRRVTSEVEILAVGRLQVSF